MMTGQKLTPKQSKAALILGATGDVSAAAETANVSRQTIYAWLSTPSFLAAVRGHEVATLSALGRRLVGLGETALSTIEGLLADERVAPAVRLRAAESVLTNLLRLREHAELEMRLMALEEAMAEAPSPYEARWTSKSTLPAGR